MKAIDERTEHTFNGFIKSVNLIIQARLGCTINDLPDTVNFGDYWDDDLKHNSIDYFNMVEAAAEDLLWDNGFEPERY